MSLITDGNDLSKSLASPGIIALAPESDPVPTSLSSIISAVPDVNGKYLPVGNWWLTGLLTDATEIEREVDFEDIDYNNQGGALRRLTEDVRTVTAHFGHVAQELIKVYESSSLTSTVAAAANASAQKLTHFGLVDSLLRYRVAVIAERDKSVAPVTLPASGGKRGARVAYIGYLGEAAPDDSIEYADDDPAGMAVAFTLYPDMSLAAGKQYGFWAEENAGQTISAT